MRPYPPCPETDGWTRGSPCGAGRRDAVVAMRSPPFVLSDSTRRSCGLRADPRARKGRGSARRPGGAGKSAGAMALSARVPRLHAAFARRVTVSEIWEDGPETWGGEGLSADRFLGAGASRWPRTFSRRSLTPERIDSGDRPDGTRALRGARDARGAPSRTFMKGLILAQNERWRRGLGMQVERDSPQGESSGERVSKTRAICPRDGDSRGKLRVIPDGLTWTAVRARKRWGSARTFRPGRSSRPIR
jgi:hypothetical protein